MIPLPDLGMVYAEKVAARGRVVAAGKAGLSSLQKANESQATTTLAGTLGSVWAGAAPVIAAHLNKPQDTQEQPNQGGRGAPRAM